MSHEDCTLAPADPRAARIRTLVADDSPLWLDPLVSFLENEPQIDLVGVAHDGLEALGHVASLMPDLALLDMRMPRLDGLKASATIRLRFPKIRIVIMSADDDARIREQCSAHGADAFVPKSDAFRILIPTFLRICTRTASSPISTEARFSASLASTKSTPYE